MKVTTRALCGLGYIAVIAASSDVRSAEFTCEAGQFNCLYDSVELANQTTEPDIIRFAEGFHYSFTAFPRRCAPPIEGNITIIGAGSDVSYLEAQGSCAFFHVESGGSLTLRDIVIASGNLDGLKVGPNEAQRGAAVYNEGHLYIEQSILRNNGINDNFLHLSGGGAIYNAPGAEARLIDVEFFFNSVGDQTNGGAAILNEGAMTVIRSRFFDNGGRGGIIVNGMPNSSADAVLTLSDTIIENNNGRGIKNGSRQHSKLLVERTTIQYGVSVEGGGIYNIGEMTARESTIAFNTAAKGAAVYSAKGSKSTFIDSTISNNHALNAGRGVGGGIFNFGGEVFIANSTISANTSDGLGAAIAVTSDAQNSANVYVKRSLLIGYPVTTVDQVCYAFGANDEPKIHSLGHNLSSEESNCPLRLETDITIDEAATFTEVIGPLADNGGSTLTHALLPGSPAIDGEGVVCTDFEGSPIVIDQRGNPRSGCDIGSVDAPAEIHPIAIELILPGKQAGIRPNTNGNIKLAVLSRADTATSFNPAVDIDRGSVRLGPADAAPFEFTERDINNDGLVDLVMKFKIGESGVACGDTTIELRGSLIGSNDFFAETAITTSGRGCGQLPRM